jgi:putative transposase
LKNKGGRPVPGYSLTNKKEKISDEQIKEWLNELICGDGFPYGYHKLTICLKEDYNLQINRKKVYRLCKELDILRPQRKIKPRHPRKLAKQAEINGSNQLWEMDVKYGYIMGTDSFFFQLSLIDVYDRSIIDYHLGLTCKSKDAVRILRNSLAKRGIGKGIKFPVIRTDNGPQFTSNLFEETVTKLGITHERIPVKTPNMNAHIESFHSILEGECYSQNEFKSFMDAYSIVMNYMRYYNERRRHGSIKFMPPVKFYKAFLDGKDIAKIEAFSA